MTTNLKRASVGKLPMKSDELFWQVMPKLQRSISVEVLTRKVTKTKDNSQMRRFWSEFDGYLWVAEKLRSPKVERKMKLRLRYFLAFI